MCTFLTNFIFIQYGKLSVHPSAGYVCGLSMLIAYFWPCWCSYFLLNLSRLACWQWLDRLDCSSISQRPPIHVRMMANVSPRSVASPCVAALLSDPCCRLPSSSTHRKFVCFLWMSVCVHMHAHVNVLCVCSVCDNMSAHRASPTFATHVQCWVQHRRTQRHIYCSKPMQKLRQIYQI